jgi:hypothetical protein
VRTIRGLHDSTVEDDLVVERPLEIRIEAKRADGSIERRSIVALRTPGSDLERPFDDEVVLDGRVVQPADRAHAHATQGVFGGGARHPSILERTISTSRCFMSG